MFIKYPKTKHLMWSPGSTSDDKFHWNLDHWNDSEVVITEKMDGENTTLYNNGLHARSLDSKHHVSRTYVKALHGNVASNIPVDWRICGENVTAVHSLTYSNLPSCFLVYSIWNEQNQALSWNDTVIFSKLLDLETVPILWRGTYTPQIALALEQQTLFKVNSNIMEGYVIRPASSFAFANFEKLVGKYVRKGHVQTDEHWLTKPIVYNNFKI